jgi:hypothetical protein
LSNCKLLLPPATEFHFSRKVPRRAFILWRAFCSGGSHGLDATCA